MQSRQAIHAYVKHTTSLVANTLHDVCRCIEEFIPKVEPGRCLNVITCLVHLLVAATLGYECWQPRYSIAVLLFPLIGHRERIVWRLTCIEVTTRIIGKHFGVLGILQVTFLYLAQKRPLRIGHGSRKTP